MRTKGTKSGASNDTPLSDTGNHSFGALQADGWLLQDVTIEAKNLKIENATLYIKGGLYLCNFPQKQAE